MESKAIPIACDLSRLSAEQREREQELLGQFRKLLMPDSETEDGFWFTLSAAPAALADLGEFLGLERLCCPFLTFQLEITPAETCRLLISGPPGAKAFMASEFMEEAG
jgi:hypothetical protein